MKAEISADIECGAEKCYSVQVLRKGGEEGE
jgi:hypothetical protein